jgi:uncharacterized protein DUF4232
MKLTSQVARRIGVAAAAASAAILIPAVAMAAPSGSAAAAHASPRCAASQLTAWIGLPATGAAGTATYQLELSNISHRSCTLQGFPGVSAIGRHAQLGHAAVRNHSHKSRLITLQPRGTAHVELGITSTSGKAPGTCGAVKAEGLKVYPPNDRRADSVDFAFETCKNRSAKDLGITTTIKGTGIPIFSS